MGLIPPQRTLQVEREYVMVCTVPGRVCKSHCAFRHVRRCLIRMMIRLILVDDPSYKVVIGDPCLQEHRVTAWRTSVALTSS